MPLIDNSPTFHDGKTFAILSSTAVITALGLGAIVPFIPLFANQMGATGVQIGFLFAGFSIARAFFNPLFGRISDTYGRKRLILIGLFFYGLLSLGYFHTNGINQLIGLRTVHGVASAMVLPVCLAYAGDLARVGREGKVMALMNAALYCGWGIGPLLGGLVGKSFGIGMTFLTMGMLAFCSLILTSLFLPAKVPTHEHENALNRGRTSIFDVIRDPIMSAVLINRAGFAMSGGAVFAFLAIYMSDFLGAGFVATSIPFVFLVCWMGLLQIPIAIGGIADRFNRVSLILVGSSIAIVGMVVMAASGSGTSVLVGCLLIGCAGAINIPAATAICTAAGRTYGMGLCMGTYQGSMSVGMVAGPLIAGYLIDHYGIHSLFYFAAGMAVLSLVGFAIFIPAAVRERGDWIKVKRPELAYNAGP